MKLAWYFKAELDLERAGDYIRLDNPNAADEVEHRLRTVVNHLTMFPDAGRVGRVKGTREVVIPEYPYLIRYRVKGDTVQILRIFHTSRRWQE